jgi:high-affinity iron transporter
MILIRPIALLLLAIATPASAQEGPAPLVRRIAGSAQLAAQEYALGVEGGRVIATAEIEEAKLFLTEAIRAAAALPGGDAELVRKELNRALAIVGRTGPPDSVAAIVDALVQGLSDRYQVDVEEVPATAPSLGQGAALFQANCARCHGSLGRGDGKDAVGLDPKPGNLANAQGLADASPLDFYRRVTIGVAGTAMPGFAAPLSLDERWAVALYASTLRLPAPAGSVPPALTAFATTARMSDQQVLDALGAAASPAALAAVRGSHLMVATDDAAARAAFGTVRWQLDSAMAAARAGESDQARFVALSAYMTFEQVERQVRVKDHALATDLEGKFTSFRDRAGADPADPEALARVRAQLDIGLERAERVIGDELSSFNLFLQSFILLLREGLEAILVVGALIAFLIKTGATSRRRDVHIGVGLALVASLLTALALETIFFLTPARQEVLEGMTMVAASVMLFYVSYWLLSKIEVARWNQFVKSQVRDAVSSGSALALATVAFLAVYREGFETVLFYKALMLTAGPGGLAPVLLGLGLGAVALGLVYVLINRFGVRLPLRPFFGVTSGFLYYMAFVFAGKAVAELQAGGLLGTNMVRGAPRVPMLGIYPTMESIAVQGLLLLLAGIGLFVTFGPPRRRRAAAAARAAATPISEGDDTRRDVLRSLDRIDADVSEIRAEVERLRDRITPKVPQ